MLKKILNFGPLFVIIAAILWSADGILRISLYSLPPEVVVFYEHLLGAFLLLFLIKKWFSDLRKMTRKEWLVIGLVSLFSGALGTILYTAALSFINYSQYSVVVLLVQQMQPVWAILFAALLLKEKIHKKFLFWASIALVSSYFVSFKDMTINLDTGRGTLYAALLALAAGFMWGSTTAFSKYVLNKVSFLTATVLRFFMAPFFAFAIILLRNNTQSMLSMSSSQWTTLVAITLSTGMVALLFYYYGLKKTTAKVGAICELVWPASAVAIDYFYYHKTLSLTQVLGVMVLLYAIYKVTHLKK